MIAAGRIHSESTFTRMLALFAQHDRERAPQPTTPQAQAIPASSFSVVDPDPVYGLSNFTRSSNEALQNGWYAYRAVLTSTVSGLAGFAEHLGDNVVFGYEQFGVAGIFAGLGNGIGSGMAEGAKSIYQHGWAQMKVAAQAYVSPELSPELAGTQIGNGIMVPIGAIGLVDGARMTFKAPAMMENGLRHGANIFEKSLSAAKNFIDDLDNNSPSGGAFATANGSIMSGGVADSAIMSLPWDASAEGLGICLAEADDPSGINDQTPLAQTMRSVESATRVAKRISEKIERFDELTASERNLLIADVFNLSETWRRIYQNFRTLASNTAKTEHLATVETMLSELQNCFDRLAKISSEQLNTISDMRPSEFSYQHISATSELGSAQLLMGKFSEAEAQFLTAQNLLLQLLEATEQGGNLRSVAQIASHGMALVQKHIFDLVACGRSVPAPYLKTLLHLAQKELQLFAQHYDFAVADYVAAWERLISFMRDNGASFPPDAHISFASALQDVTEIARAVYEAGHSPKH